VPASPKVHDELAGTGDEVLVKVAASLIQTLAGDVNELVNPPITTGTVLLIVSSQPLLLVVINVTI
jgi:hypothetical protein